MRAAEDRALSTREPKHRVAVGAVRSARSPRRGRTRSGDEHLAVEPLEEDAEARTNEASLGGRADPDVLARRDAMPDVVGGDVDPPGLGPEREPSRRCPAGAAANVLDVASTAKRRTSFAGAGLSWSWVATSSISRRVAQRGRVVSASEYALVSTTTPPEGEANEDDRKPGQAVALRHVRRRHRAAR